MIFATDFLLAAFSVDPKVDMGGALTCLSFLVLNCAAWGRTRSIHVGRERGMGCTEVERWDETALPLSYIYGDSPHLFSAIE